VITAADRILNPAPSSPASLRSPTGGTLLFELVVALPVGWFFSHLHLGSITWIFAGIFAGTCAMRLAQSQQIAPRPNPRARRLGQALVGMAIGFAIQHQDLAGVVAQLPVFALLTLLLLGSGWGIGYLYARWSQTNLLEALLATVPGGVGVMSSIAADYGRNVTQVAMVQILRVTTVVVGIPLLAGWLSGTGLNPRGTLPQSFGLAALSPTNLALLLLALGCTSLGVIAAQKLKIPAAPFFGAIAVGVLYNPLLNLLPGITGLAFTPPPLLSLLGQILLGVTIGEYWGCHLTPQTGALEQATGSGFNRRALSGAILSVSLTLMAGLVAAAVAHALTTWDWLTCLLVTAPGGAPEMILVSLALHHEVETVTAGHLVRLIAINGSLPIWVLLFSRLDRHLQPTR
jgi:uncharacterized protein